jgi:hypothetical protein
MEGVILTLLYILAAIILIFVGFAFIIKLFVSGLVWRVSKFILILGIVIYVYFKLGGYIYAFYLTWVPFKYVNKNMRVWDDIWYTILIIFIIIMCSVFIKSVKINNINWERLFYGLGALALLGFYSIAYYLYLYYDYIGTITGILTVAMILASGIVVMIKNFGVSYGYAAPFFMIYSVIGLSYIMACFLFLFYVLNKCYDWVA